MPQCEARRLPDEREPARLPRQPRPYHPGQHQNWRRQPFLGWCYRFRRARRLDAAAAGQRLRLRRQGGVQRRPVRTCVRAGLRHGRAVVWGLGGGGCGTASCIDSTFKTTLLDSAGGSIDSFTFNAPNDVAAFIGVSSTTPYNTVQVRKIVGARENEYFGHFYTGSARGMTVSEPGQGVLLLGGLAAVVGIVRRRKKIA